VILLSVSNWRKLLVNYNEMQKKNSSRPSRVATEIKKILSEFLLRGFFIDSDDGGEKINPTLLSITDVVMSPCLQHAKVSVALMLDDVSEESCLEFLKRHTPQLRHEIGTKIRLKFVPDLSFFIDDSFKCRSRIESLLHSQDVLN